MSIRTRYALYAYMPTVYAYNISDTGGNFRQEKISLISPPVLVGESFYLRTFCPVLMIA